MSYKYYENHSCEYYPCHSSDKINCLFCFCPLYSIKDCGGNFGMIKDKNGKSIKDCSNCLLPHMADGYEFVIKKLKEQERPDASQLKRGLQIKRRINS